jgi:hypothetical protein
MRLPTVLSERTSSISYALSALDTLCNLRSSMEPDAHWMHTVPQIAIESCLKIADRSREQFGLPKLRALVDNGANVGRKGGFDDEYV